jgi:hypothetical protein
MKDGLYHKTIGIPANAAKSFLGHHRLIYTAHARVQATLDRYGKLPTPETILIGLAEIIEIEVEAGWPVKIVVRINSGVRPGLDLVLVLRPTEGGLRVVTLWGNLATDNHRTLNRAAYQTP